MATKSEKLALSIFAAIVLVLGVGFEFSGSFVPEWTFRRNSTDEDVSFSLWTRVECFDTICTTRHLKVKWQTTECILEGTEQKCSTKSGYKTRPETKCVKANYCNKTWHHEEDFNEIPSLLLVSKCFVTPGIVSGTIALLLYTIKIVLMVRSPAKRLHLKAAYLTFAAIGGAAAGVGVVIFCTMLDKDTYVLGWAPALPGVGGFLQLCVAFGGYLSWRDKYSDEFDDISLSSDRPIDRQAPTHRKKYHKESYSNNSGLSAAATPLTSNV